MAHAFKRSPKPALCTTARLQADTLKAKDILRLEGPFSSFFLRDESPKPIVLLASGAGFAPIKALIAQLRFKGSKRPAVLYWAAAPEPICTCTRPFWKSPRR